MIVVVMRFYNAMTTFVPTQIKEGMDLRIKLALLKP